MISSDDTISGMSFYPRPVSSSRCSQPEGAPYVWHDFVDLQHDSVRKFDEFLAGLAPFARADEEGQIWDLHEAAAAGDLWESADDEEPLKPIVSDPEIYELRLKLLRTYRFYHAEPGHRPELLVKLHRHIKDDEDLQQGEIEHAIDRFHKQA